jgi:hypothetical protein
MRKRGIFAIAAMHVLLMAAPSAFAWDGAVTGKIISTDVAPGSNYGFRVTLAGTPQMCSNGQTWAFLNEGDSNYKTFVAVLLLAKSQGAQVTVYSTQVGGFCQIGYIAAS